MMKSRIVATLIALSAIVTTASAQELPHDLVTAITFCGPTPAELSETGLPGDFVAAAEQTGEICIQLEVPLLQFISNEEFYPDSPYRIEVWRYDDRMTATIVAGAERIEIRTEPSQEHPTGADWSYREFPGYTLDCPTVSVRGAVTGQPLYNGAPLEGLPMVRASGTIYLMQTCGSDCSNWVESNPPWPPVPAYREAVDYDAPSCAPGWLRADLTGEDRAPVFLTLGDGRSFEVAPSLSVSIERDSSWGGLKAQFKQNRQ